MVLCPGTYEVADQLLNTDKHPVNNGIRFFGLRGRNGERPVVKGKFILRMVKDIEFNGIDFVSLGRGFIDPLEKSANISIINCKFNKESPTNAADKEDRYTGINAIYVKGFIFRACKLDSKFPWPGDFISAEYSSQLLFSDNDFSDCSAGHSFIKIDKSREAIIQRSYFRNPISRAVVCRNSNGIVVQDNLFFDCDWNGLKPCPHPFGNRGDGATLRFAVMRSVVRNNIFAGQNYNPGGDACKSQIDKGYSNMQGALSFNIFDGSPRYGIVRGYHNTYFMNQQSGIFFEYPRDFALADEKKDPSNANTANNKFINEVLFDCGRSFRIEGEDRRDGFEIRVDNVDVKFKTYLFDRCYLWHRNANDAVIAIKEPDRATIVKYTAEDAQATLRDSNNEPIFRKNVFSKAPKFHNPKLFVDAKENPLAFSGLAWIGEFFRSLSLSSGDAPRGREIARIDRRSIVHHDTDKVQLDRVGDAWCFTSGFGMIPGDVILIEGQPAPFTILEVRSDTELQLDRTLVTSLVAPSPWGPRVWLKRYGRRPGIGVIPGV